MVSEENNQVEDADGVEDLAQLAREADLLDAAPAQAKAASVEAAAVELVGSTSDELLGLLQMVRGMVFPMLGMVIDKDRMAKLAQIWHDGVLGQSAAAGAQIMVLHGWTLNGAFDRYGPYVALGVALAPPVLMTREVMRQAPKAAQAAAAVEGAGDGA